MILVLIYFAPLFVALSLSAHSFFKLLKHLKKSTESDKGKSIVSENDRHKDMPIGELRNLKPYVIHQIWLFVSGSALVFVFPVVMLRLAIMTRWGSKVWWLSPVNLIEIWRVGFIALGYYYTEQGNYYMAFALAGIVGNSALYELLGTFRKKDGILSILSTPRHKVNIRNISEAGLTLVLAYASTYYTLSVFNPTSFSKPLTILDSIYFSVITIATVGYGDISPVSAQAKVLTITQILLGLLYIVFVIGVFLNIYVRNHEPEL